ncbi:MAG: FkbM family methyltransferase [Bacteroidota bacterium]|nr:FkbM family methyltransferase [Bacteroidota bacterium]MDP4217381.1 FkbM family methyltransferase [Bacteroidota bacterium]MDP4246754.1 FkbM family methyltransferase [Bacteroidota bacterium]MDP4254250.1 FkbM family methyltransferase [Bacteroidota bacterium]MDP4260725.1 FkbM family methyltransferase [Bacteroidota bacterium]
MQGTTLFKRCLEKHLVIRHACEVGVFTPERSNILDFITRDKVRATLVEPDPQRIAAIKKYFAPYPGVTLYPYAVYDHNGTLELAQRGESTFATALPFSPAVINDQYQIKKEDTFTVECKRFDAIDDGTIDLLHIDTEGCEWFVLKYLKSRPLVISLETHGKSYSNPYLAEILAWMETNGYKRWYAGKSDSVFRREGAFPITGAEKRRLAWMDGYLKFRKFRKSLFRNR